MGQQAGRAIGRMIHYGKESTIPSVYLDCCGRTVTEAREGHAAWCLSVQAERERDRAKREALPVLYEKTPGGAQPDPSPRTPIQAPRCMTRGERAEKRRALAAWIVEKGHKPEDIDVSTSYMTRAEAREHIQNTLRAKLLARLQEGK